MFRRLGSISKPRRTITDWGWGDGAAYRDLGCRSGIERVCGRHDRIQHFEILLCRRSDLVWYCRRGTSICLLPPMDGGARVKVGTARKSPAKPGICRFLQTNTSYPLVKVPLSEGVVTGYSTPSSTVCCTYCMTVAMLVEAPSTIGAVSGRSVARRSVVQAQCATAMLPATAKPIPVRGLR